MKFKTMIVVAAFAAAGGGSALAQGMGPGGAGPTPEMRAARQAMRLACATDAKTLCGGKAGPEMRMCMRENMAKVSTPCKDAIAKMPRRPGPAQPAI